MSWIPFYADENDFTLILENLNLNPEIAYILSKGKKKWVACDVVDQIYD